MPSQFRIELDKQNTHACPSCGHLTRVVWGYLYEDDKATAAYYVRWTMEHVKEHGAHFDLMIGGWGEHTTPTDRVMVTLLYRPWPQGGFMVVDATITSDSERKLVASALRREKVIGTELAQRCFKMVDTIWLQDGRISELVLMGDADTPGHAS